VDGHLDREAGGAQAPEHRVVKPEVGRSVVCAPLHQADRPAVPREGVPRRDRPRAQGRLPVAVRRRGFDLAEDDVDHAVEQVVLAGDVVVERHRLDAELLRELAHGHGLEAASVREGDRGTQHPFSAQGPPAVL
jgi:hypothetical protein